MNEWFVGGDGGKAIRDFLFFVAMFPGSEPSVSRDETEGE
jgi:hypothetical protein